MNSVLGSSVWQMVNSLGGSGVAVAVGAGIGVDVLAGSGVVAVMLDGRIVAVAAVPHQRAFDAVPMHTTSYVE